MRGEYLPNLNNSHIGIGSPPLARGIRIPCCFKVFSPGITPACAGNTVFDGWDSNAAKDHPRLRGEYSTARSPVTSTRGSPPLARGIRRVIALYVSRVRITPACAGNTLKKSLIYNLFPISISKFHLVSQTPEML